MHKLFKTTVLLLLPGCEAGVKESGSPGEESETGIFQPEEGIYEGEIKDGLPHGKAAALIHSEEVTNGLFT